MKTTIGTFWITFTNLHHGVDPSLARSQQPFPPIAGTMRLLYDERVVLEWDNDDIELTLAQFETADSFELDANLYIDVFRNPDKDLLDLTVWLNDCPLPDLDMSIRAANFAAAIESAKCDLADFSVFNPTW